MNYQSIEISKAQALDNKIVSQFVQHRRDSNVPHPCFYNHDEYSCNDRSIMSHVMSKALLKKYIATNSQVYVPNTASSLKARDFNIEYKLTGVNKATTFYGFCQKHDNEIFADIDGDNWRPTEKQIILCFYRSLSFEMLQKMRASTNIESVHDTIAKEMGISSNESISDLLMGAMFQQLGIMDCIPLHKHLQNLIYRQDFENNISYASWNTTERLPIACFGVFAPACDVRGNVIQDFSNTTHPLENLLLAIVPAALTSNITVACIPKHSIAREYIRMFLGEEKDRIPDIAVKLILENCENHCCNPNWYNNLTAKKKKDILGLLKQITPKKTVYRNFPKIIENTAVLINASTDIGVFQHSQ